MAGRQATARGTEAADTAVAQGRPGPAPGTAISGVTGVTDWAHGYADE